VSSVLLVGLGDVGIRAARQLVETDGIDRVLLAGHRHRGVEELAETFGDRAEASEFRPGDPLPDVDAVACALPDDLDVKVVTTAVAQGIAVASSTDAAPTIDRLRALSDMARSREVTVALGCGLAPGLSDVLARHGAQAFDEVDEITVARFGCSGAASVATVRAELCGRARDWYDGAWRSTARPAEEIVWFPEPIGARDCRTVTAGVSLLVDAFPGVPCVGVRLGEAQRRRFAMHRRVGDEGEWGATRVEIYGRRGRERDVVVYGVIERTAVAAGTVLALVAAQLCGAGGSTIHRPGVHGLAALVEPVPFLSELAARGVRVATFEGAPVG
jgi:saccharopine dehydrogenase-like NADP-dependent oxidoreductase